MKQIDHRYSIPQLYRFIIVVVILSLLASCSGSGDLLGLNNTSDKNVVEIQFKASLQEPLPPNSQLMLEIVDDVTGVYFNSTRYKLTQENEQLYSVAIPFSVFSDS
jgi:hypothetical protein